MFYFIYFFVCIGNEDFGYKYNKSINEVKRMNRKDSWSAENDHILAEAILESVRNGGTQGEGFKVAAERLSRTPAACGFRWNSKVRKQYEDELEKAKQEKRTLRENKNQKLDIPDIAENSEDPFEILTKAVEEATAAYKRLQRDHNKLRRENVRLEQKLQEIPNGEDLDNLINMLNNARKLGFLKNESSAG